MCRSIGFGMYHLHVHDMLLREIPWGPPLSLVWVEYTITSLDIINTSFPSSMSSRSPVPVQHPGPAGDSSSHTSPSSAEYYTPSDSTIQSVGAVNAETSNKDSSSFTVEFKDSQRYRCVRVYSSLHMLLTIQ